ncbi:MAG: sulfoacetaldehyde acetyltransferase [Archaeoglobi archaeon]|jgi:sulfoacetaldehyde acetyltransferase|nr:sulfoacetaldehyde acetyltransferase [Archaeoglobi archaeon]
MKKIRMSGSEAIAETLVAEGVNHVAGIVGSAFMDLLDLFPDAGIRFISVRHEQSAAHMEDGYARVTGKAGVCIGQNGPGITNMVTGVAAANMAHTPLVVIAPSAMSTAVGWNSFQECDQVSVFRAITKKSIRVPNPSRIAECLRTAFRIAYAERGAVLYDIPRDYFYAELEDVILEPKRYRVDKRGPGAPELLDEAVSILRDAERPAIIAGRGVVDSDAIPEVVALAEYLKAPVACSYLHNDAFPASHPLWMGPIGYMGSKAAMLTLSEADVILAIGTRLSAFGTIPQYGISYITGESRIIQVDINPLNIGQIHPVEVGIIGDAKETARELLARLRKAGISVNRDSWVKTAMERRKEWEKEIYELAMIEGKPINPRRALYELTKALPKGTIVATDVGNVASIANSYLKFDEGRKHIAACTFGNTGFAYPAALGAKLGRPDLPVVAIIGDGAWGMSLHEVSTAVEHNIPVVACVFNNQSWGAEKRNQIDFYNSRFIGVDIKGPCFAEVAKVMGAHGVRVNRADEICAVVEEAIELNRPAVIEIMVDPEQLAPPFRRDALRFPRRYLPKYRHLDYENWKK